MKRRSLSNATPVKRDVKRCIASVHEIKKPLKWNTFHNRFEEKGNLDKQYICKEPKLETLHGISA